MVDSQPKRHSPTRGPLSENQWTSDNFEKRKTNTGYRRPLIN